MYRIPITALKSQKNFEFKIHLGDTLYIIKFLYFEKVDFHQVYFYNELGELLSTMIVLPYQDLLRADRFRVAELPMEYTTVGFAAGKSIKSDLSNIEFIYGDDILTVLSGV